MFLRRYTLILFIILSLSFFTSVQNTNADTITIDTKTVYQTIDGIGGNFAKGRFDGFVTVNDASGRYNLDNLSVEHARIGIPLKGWEAANDNDDPEDINMSNFAIDINMIKNVFRLMQELDSRDIPIQAAIWDAPDWMLTPETRSLYNQSIFREDMYDTLIESITAFMIHARDEYGIYNVEYISFN